MGLVQTIMALTLNSMEASLITNSKIINHMGVEYTLDTIKLALSPTRMAIHCMGSENNHK